MIGYFLVFLGGGFGSMCRYGIAHLLARLNWTFPVATLLANAISCVILGALVGLSVRSGLAGNYRLLLMTGFCGGFSTFSTFSAETFHLLQTGHIALGLLNMAASLIVCLIAIYAGIRLVG